MYSAELGRFLTRDPIGYRGGINLVAYVGNNPPATIDPHGNQCRSASCIATLSTTTGPQPDRRSEGHFVLHAAVYHPRDGKDGEIVLDYFESTNVGANAENHFRLN